MGLIDKEVLVRWNSKSKKHYIEKGYAFTKSGDFFNVRIEDLTTGSHVKVKCECEKCNNIFDVEYCNYLINNVDGNYYCNKCAKENAKNKEIRTKLSKTTTFEQWCKDKNNNLLDLWDYDLNKIKPNEIAYKSGQEVWFKCNHGEHPSYKRKLSNSHTYDFRCPECTRERNESMIQEKVRLYLETLSYTILHENNCTIIPTNPKTKHSLPFDNEIKELKLIIEVHGCQHYKVSAFTPSFEELHYLRLKDRYKRLYCKNKGYHYLEISYKDIKDNDNYIQLINNKIKEIKKSL